MTVKQRPHQIIAAMVSAREFHSDSDLLAELAALPPLADEHDTCWQNEEYWNGVVFPYLALADLAATRRLRPAIPLLLERACYGDPGEIMRGLRHNLEAIVAPNYAELTDVCLDAAHSSRFGTRLWAIDELAVLADARARAIFEEAVVTGPELIRSCAMIGLDRLQ